jgi:hypothetical protein
MNAAPVQHARPLLLSARLRLPLPEPWLTGQSLILQLRQAITLRGHYPPAPVRHLILLGRLRYTATKFMNDLHKYANSPVMLLIARLAQLIGFPILTFILLTMIQVSTNLAVALSQLNSLDKRVERLENWRDAVYEPSKK